MLTNSNVLPHWNEEFTTIHPGRRTTGGPIQSKQHSELMTLRGSDTVGEVLFVCRCFPTAISGMDELKSRRKQTVFCSKRTGDTLGVLSLSAPRGPCLPFHSCKCAERFKLSSLDKALLSEWKCYHLAGHISTCLSDTQKTLIYSMKICSKIKCHENVILTYHDACYTHLFGDHRTITFVNVNKLLWTSYCSYVCMNPSSQETPPITTGAKTSATPSP